MKWNQLFTRRGRRQGSTPVPGLFVDDAVHKRSKHKGSTAAEELAGVEHDDHHPLHHEHPQHADDRTEGTQTSCSSIGIHLHGLEDSPPHPLSHTCTSTVPQHIIQNLESPRSKTGVQFSTVEMRHYQRIVGDHPDLEIPLAIGWEFVQGPPLSVHELEEQKETRKANALRDLRLPFPTTHGNVNNSGGLWESSRLSSHTTTTSNTIVSPPKVLHRAPAFSDSGRAGLLANNKALAAAQHMDSADITSKYLEPISVKERIFLLQTVGGYSLEQIHQAERRRRVQIVLEWAYR